MAVEYDLVIVGATTAGIQAAIAAANWQARVALVTQNLSPTDAPELAHLHIWQAIAQSPDRGSVATPDPWERLNAWATAAIANLQEIHAPAVLASRGIDVVMGVGEFCRKPAPGLLVKGRLLRARAYLLTVGCHFQPPSIPGLDTTDYVTLSQLPVVFPTLRTGQAWAVIGHDPIAIALAQTLQRLGMTVTLLFPETAAPFTGDREADNLLQAQIEADGIQIRRDSILQIQTKAGNPHIHLRQHTLIADRLLVVGTPAPNVAMLNLEAVNVQWDDRGIRHSATLQTTNPRIYACEGRIGQDVFAQVAQYEAAIAVQNALFFPRRKATVRSLPLRFPTLPETAWVGLSEAEAKQRYGAKLHVLYRAFNTLPAAHLQSDLTGFCKLFVHRNGHIVGAIAIGPQAHTVIHLVAIAIQHSLKLSALAALVVPTPAIAEILTQLGTDWQQRTIAQTHWLQDLLENFFNWRRSWTP